jgi:hypothetical protein
MNSLRWVIQENLGSSKEIEELFRACEKLGIEAMPVRIVPFSNEIPDIPNDKLAIFYGSANFVFNAKRCGKWNPCAFFDDETFRFSHWSNKYGSSVLNSDALICSMRDLSLSEHPNDEMFFIRPDRDLKEFSGQLISFEDYLVWYSKIDRSDLEMTINPDTAIVVATPKNLSHEWRLFMVKNRYCTGSHYRSDGNLVVTPDVPDEVIQFAETQANVWYPDAVYVLDVGQCENGFYIIEINGFNSTGFYSSNIYNIVHEVSEMVKNGEHLYGRGSQEKIIPP